jgi:hypothetical protein
MDHRASLLSLLFTGALLAQSPLVLPGSHLAREGSSTTNVPFGRSSPTRVQSCYDPMLFPGPVTIQSLALRIDGGATAAAKVVDVEIRMSTMPGTVLALSADFAQNRGLDETTVLPQQLLTLPAHTTIASPNSFAPPIQLAVPFAYDPALGSLLIEIIVYGQPPGAYPLDITYVCDSPEVPIGPVACAQPGGPPLRVESSTTQVMWGRPWVARVLDAPPGALVTLGLGTVESGPWGGFVLPQDLGLLGAPGCFVSIDIAGSLFSVAAGDGSAAFPFVIPNTPAAIGYWIRFQGGAVVPGANALGIITSQARKVQVCGWEPVGRVWASGLATTFGTREIGVAPVTQLIVQ